MTISWVWWFLGYNDSLGITILCVWRFLGYDDFLGERKTIASCASSIYGSFFVWQEISMSLLPPSFADKMASMQLFWMNLLQWSHIQTSARRKYKTRLRSMVKKKKLSLELSVVPITRHIQGDKIWLSFNKHVTGIISIYTLWHMQGNVPAAMGLPRMPRCKFFRYREV